MTRHNFTTPRGTIMMQVLLALPLVIMVLAMMFFVGRGMMRIQHAQGMSRYESWRRASHVPPELGPYADNQTGNVLMNQTFFNGTADSIVFEGGDAMPTDLQSSLIGAARDRSVDAAELAGAVMRDLPHGQTVWFETRHSTMSALGQLFGGPLRQQHTRLDHDWRYASGWRTGHAGLEPSAPHARNSEAIREVFLSEFDARLEASATQGNKLAGVIRLLYLGNEGYRGPDVEFE